MKTTMYNQNMDSDIFDDEEIDLVALVSANANDNSQYLIFQGSDEQYYAKNVSKIEELLVYKDIEIAKNNANDLIIGTADIRGNMTTITNFDQWFGNFVLDDDVYELIILANYGGHKLGIVVKSVEYIVNIPADTMSDNSGNNEKTSFVTKVQIGSKKEICTIFDSDKMLLDIFPMVDSNAMKETKTVKKMENNKLVLFADDSKFVRKMAEDLFNTMEVNYRLYDNGKKLIDDLENISKDEIGLFITDLEMPVLGGREVIAHIRDNKNYDDINIIVHTNMSNNTMSEDLIKQGAQRIIGKINMLALSSAMKELII